MPAPTIEPTTMAVSEKNGNFPSAVDSVGDAVVAVEDTISFPFDLFPPPARAPCSVLFVEIIKYYSLIPNSRFHDLTFEQN
jgi:hypothetical protein